MLIKGLSGGLGNPIEVGEEMTEIVRLRSGVVVAGIDDWIFIVFNLYFVVKMLQEPNFTNDCVTELTERCVSRTLRYSEQDEDKWEQKQGN